MSQWKFISVKTQYSALGRIFTLTYNCIFFCALFLSVQNHGLSWIQMDLAQIQAIGVPNVSHRFHSHLVKSTWDSYVRLSVSPRSLVGWFHWLAPGVIHHGVALNHHQTAPTQNSAWMILRGFISTIGILSRWV